MAKKNEQTALFEERFLKSFTGSSIVSDQKVAIMELIANAWDAGASVVDIKWPIIDGEVFSVTDNGEGMTENDYNTKFRMLAYDKIKNQGLYAHIPGDNGILGKRPVFGRNGKGRFAGFAFGDSFQVKTFRDKKQIIFKVFINALNSPTFEILERAENIDGHGTSVLIENAVTPFIEANDIKTEISMRFLTDPHFEVFVNNEKISFANIPEENVTVIPVVIDEIGTVNITVIDIKSTDKTTHQHGVAWHVNKRLVGECTWKNTKSEYLLDGRRIAAKRYTFIVSADCLHDAVLPDWTGFNPHEPKFEKVNDIVQEKIKDFILQVGKETREETMKHIKEENQNILKELSLVSREKWEMFIENIQEECPSINETDLSKLASVLANLEKSESKFGLINQLFELNPEQLDKVNDVFLKWDIDTAKIVLDELQFRLTLLEKLKLKTDKESTDEVQELQPLFHTGLWIFGPEYETIEYTSNEGMTKVIQNLLGGTGIEGTRIRPDFVISTDSTVGLYSYPKYDEEGNEIGVDKLTIVELKKPKIPISGDQKEQAWKYVKEIDSHGLLRNYSSVTCFVLGSELDPQEAHVRTEKNETVRIIPLDYGTIIKRAESRLLKLYKKVSQAPFLQDIRLKEYLDEKAQMTLNL